MREYISVIGKRYTVMIGWKRGIKDEPLCLHDFEFEIFRTKCRLVNGKLEIVLLLSSMSLSSAEQGQSEQSALLPKQTVDHGHFFSRKKGVLLLGLTALVGLSTFFLGKGELTDMSQRIWKHSRY